MTIRPFTQPIYVTRPVFPPLKSFTQRLESVWSAAWLTNMGAQHQLLERALREHLRVAELSLFCNGTIALMVAAKALDLEGEVLTTPFTFAATPHSLEWNRLTPVFCDLDPQTCNLDPAAAEARVTERTSAILAVHVFGQPCDVDGLEALARRHGLKIIYDAAHAFGLEVDGRSIGQYGDITMYSFHATKLFHTAEGGALACTNRDLKQRIDQLKNFDIRNEETVGGLGLNGKMNEVQAALGLAVLEVLDEERTRRARIEDIYRQILAGVDGVILPPLNHRVTRKSLQYFPIRIVPEAYGRSRDTLHELMKEYNVITRKYFFPLCSQYPCYAGLPSANPMDLPVAHMIVNQCLTLPFYGALSDQDATRIAEMIGALRA